MVVRASGSAFSGPCHWPIPPKAEPGAIRQKAVIRALVASITRRLKVAGKRLPDWKDPVSTVICWGPAPILIIVVDICWAPLKAVTEKLSPSTSMLTAATGLDR